MDVNTEAATGRSYTRKSHCKNEETNFTIKNNGYNAVTLIIFSSFLGNIDI